jgi:hypothetical protein
VRLHVLTTLCLFALAATRAEGGGVGLSAQIGYWNANTPDGAVATVFGGSPAAIGAGVALHVAVVPRIQFVASVDGFQGSTEKGFRQTGTRPTIVVDESVWLRMLDLLVGPRFNTGSLGHTRLHAALLGGPTLIDQRIRQVGFTDSFTPEPTRDWKATIEAAAGVEFRTGRVWVGPEVLWRHMVGDVTLAQLHFTPQPLNGWGVRLRVRFGR